MNGIASTLRRLRRRYALLGRTGRWLAIGLLALVLGGGGWLAVSSGSAPYAPVLEEALCAEDLLTAANLLGRHGIPTQTRRGRLLVPESSLGQARTLLEAEGLGAGAADLFSALAGEGDLWETDSRHARRWQAAKMAWLSRRIASFEGVRKATVIFEPGSPRRLGSPGSEATAAVQVEMKPHRDLSQPLVEAVADLVSGGIPDLARQNVRIVDGVGRSYRATDAAGSEALARLRAAEAHYAEKIRHALSYTGDPLVSVHVEAQQAAPRCVAAAVSVPRSYLADLHRRQARGPATKQQIDALAADQLPRIRQMAAAAAGLAAEQVEVDWRYDGPEAAAAPANAGSGWLTLGFGLIGGGGLLLLAVAILRRGRRREGSQEMPGEAWAESQPFGFCRMVDPQALAEALENDPPQTTALVLSHLDAGRAADVLARMPVDQQAEIARHIAGRAPVDAETVRQAQEALARRLAEAAGIQAGGPDALARILQHSGYDTEQAVMKSLAGAEPHVAQYVRNRLFLFEDLAEVPARRLRSSLEIIEPDELAIALRTAGERVTRKLLSALPGAAARRVKDEMDRIGPVRLSDVEAAQQRVVDVVRSAEYGRYVPTAAARQKELTA